MDVSATEFKNRLGQYLETAQREPVMIRKSGRTTTVLLSQTRYQELEAMEDLVWELRAQLAEREGFLDEGETRKLFGP